MTHPARRWPAALLTVIATMVPATGMAAWPNHPATNLPVSTAGGFQQSHDMAPDGRGGAFIAWQQSPIGNQDIYVHHILVTGALDPAFPAGGLVVCNAAGHQQYPKLAIDGAGGVYVVWEDARNTYTDIYAHHLLVSGALDPLWAANGVPVTSVPNSNELLPVITADGLGGAVVAWQDQRLDSSYDIYAHHLRATGVDGTWTPNGVPVCGAINGQSLPVLAADGSGGAVIAWQDTRSGIADIYAHHVRASGSMDPTWPTDGRGVCTLTNHQMNPVLVTDGSGGAIIAWEDSRTGTNNTDIYVGRVDAYGAVDVYWGATGVPVCTAASEQRLPAMVSDGAGGVVVTWRDQRTGSTAIYAARVLPSGVVDTAWPADGQLLTGSFSGADKPRLVLDGMGGAIVCWEEFRFNSYNIFAQRVVPGLGLDPNWAADGEAVCTAASNQFAPILVADGREAAILAWRDARTGQFCTYAQRIDRFGYLGTPEPVITSVHDVPNDQGGRVKLSWNASYLDLTNDPNLQVYEIYRSVPPNVAAARLASGTRLTTSLAKPASSDESVLRATIANGTTYYWEFLGSDYPRHFLAGYSYLAATSGDSTANGNPTTAFMVVGRDYTSLYYWLSFPVSGYSVDNLPPGVPAAFTGSYAAGTTRLHWTPNAETDFAIYRIYRGWGADFVPSDDNLVATQPDTGYVDTPGAAAYYKILAMDVHGNVSAFAAYGPDATGVGEMGQALAPLLSGPIPNPAATATVFRVALRQAGSARLTLYNAAGRRIRTLLTATLPAGEREMLWDLTDQAGRPVPNGIYFARLETGNRSSNRAVLVLR